MKYTACVPLRLKSPEGVIDLKEGDTFIPSDPETVKPLLDGGRIRPITDIMDEEYRNLGNWLASYPVTADEIKEADPELYEAIQKAIEEMDRHFETENLQGFIESLERVKNLYLSFPTFRKGQERTLFYRRHKEVMNE